MGGADRTGAGVTGLDGEGWEEWGLFSLELSWDEGCVRWDWAPACAGVTECVQSGDGSFGADWVSACAEMTEGSGLDSVPVGRWYGGTS